MFNRGQFTEELKEKYNITLKQLRLLPYFQYLLMNNACVDPVKINDEERKILARWRDEGKITFSMLEPCTCTKEFWNWMNDILWDSYVPHLSYTSDEKLIIKDKVRRTKDTNPCDNCIELECENHGVVCPHYRADMREANNDKVN